MYAISFFYYSILILCSYCHCLDPGSFSAVLDIDGQELGATEKYYILPASHVRGNGGGLALSSRDGTCPHFVMQESHAQSNGHPVRLLPVNKVDGKISLSSDVNIVFHAATTCVQATGWKMGGVDAITGRRYVKSGALTGRPGASTVSNWFKVENEHGDGYKIVFCPSVCSFCKVVCGDVGVFDENGKKWLGLSDGYPHIVNFKKT
ncbi:Alpha-amylasesubtilisin inhibitor [Heracleum sosnowskyi]|uniref:Alpha-amylasesubtilisin inhibitor n=1 Tax=Heracleum sosnowskyi TaxID=360622 RepID=A0AAD8I9V7_9APIA|nr:Alpha-amylasesubtilisin inhibitor [Heracleum sosnowskyi]